MLRKYNILRLSKGFRVYDEEKRREVKKEERIK